MESIRFELEKLWFKLIIGLLAKFNNIFLIDANRYTFNELVLLIKLWSKS
jgi:hypothetical protein